MNEVDVKHRVANGMPRVCRTLAARRHLDVSVQRIEQLGGHVDGGGGGRVCFLRLAMHRHCIHHPAAQAGQCHCVADGLFLHLLVSQPCAPGHVASVRTLPGRGLSLFTAALPVTGFTWLAVQARQRLPVGPCLSQSRPALRGGSLLEARHSNGGPPCMKQGEAPTSKAWQSGCWTWGAGSAQ
jgi:hypothetical protein